MARRAADPQLARPAVRIGSALAVGVCVLNLGACDGMSADSRLAARQAKIDPPRLWLAESLGPTGAVTRTIDVCADRGLREGFVRAQPEVNGEPCLAISPTVTKPGLYALRCEAMGQSFAVTVTTQGDPQRDFQVRYALTSLEGGRGPFVQTIHYRVLGACPQGWDIGDQQRAGRFVRNALS